MTTPRNIPKIAYVREIKKYQWDIQGKGKSTITDKLRRTTRTRQKQHRHNTKKTQKTKKQMNNMDPTKKPGVAVYSLFIQPQMSHFYTSLTFCLSK